MCHFPLPVFVFFTPFFDPQTSSVFVQDVILILDTVLEAEPHSFLWKKKKALLPGYENIQIVRLQKRLISNFSSKMIFGLQLQFGLYKHPINCHHQSNFELNFWLFHVKKNV